MDKLKIKVMKLLITVTGLFILVIVSAWILSIGIDKQFVVDCYQWQDYESKYPLFELKASLVEACAEEGIEIK